MEVFGSLSCLLTLEQLFSRNIGSIFVRTVKARWRTLTTRIFVVEWDPSGGSEYASTQLVQWSLCRCSVTSYHFWRHVRRRSRSEVWFWQSFALLWSILRLLWLISALLTCILNGEKLQHIRHTVYTPAAWSCIMTTHMPSKHHPNNRSLPRSYHHWWALSKVCVARNEVISIQFTSILLLLVNFRFLSNPGWYRNKYMIHAIFPPSCCQKCKYHVAISPRLVLKIESCISQ